jgi:hypothetical protein
MPPRLLRASVTAALLACVAIEVARGGDSLPTWLANVSLKTGLGPDRALRVLLALQAAAAIIAAAPGALWRPVAWLTGGALAFSGLAELSAIVNAPGTAPVPAGTWIAPAAGLAVGSALLWAMGRPGTAPGPARRIGAWTVLGTLALLTVSLAVSARLPLAERTKSSTGADGIETIVLNPDEWIGRTAAEAGIARHVPQLTALTLEGTKWVVFYSPRCGRCHDVFNVYFKGDNKGEVIAVEVPPATGEKLLESDQPGEVECINCERLSLPAGPRWVLTPPTIVRFEEGKVACVTWSDYTRCRHDPESSP